MTTRLSGKGRGSLGGFRPLHGTWRARANSGMRPVVCDHASRPILDGKFLELTSRWTIVSGAQAKRVRSR